MNLQVSHAARSRLCLSEDGHWLDEEAATVNGHGGAFSVRSHFPGRSLALALLPFLRLWPARSGPSGSCFS